MSFIKLVPSFVRTHLPAGTHHGDSLRPHYQIDENAEAWLLTVALPGVAKGGLDLSVEDGEIRLRAKRAWKQPEGWTARYRETHDLPYELTLSHDNAINLDAVNAALTDGILTVTLPKAEARKPRKITVA